MSEREELIAKVAEAVGEIPITPVDEYGSSRLSGYDAHRIAEAAFDVLVQEWSPPF